MTVDLLCKCAHQASEHIHGEEGNECKRSCKCGEFRLAVRPPRDEGLWLDDLAGAGPSIWEAKNRSNGKWDPLESTCRHASLSIL